MFGRAENTQRAYRSDWNHFVEWCKQQDLKSLPAEPQTVNSYLFELASQGYKTNTLQRRKSAICASHEMAGYDSPTRTETFRKAYRRMFQTFFAPPKGKTPMLLDDILLMVKGMPETLSGKRDKALILVGFAGAFRRTELVALNMDDVEFTDSGMKITVQRSKTDQDGYGIKKGIPFAAHEVACPVRSLKAWLAVSGITEGQLFRPIAKGSKVQQSRLSDKSVANIVKQYAELAGLDPTLYSAHSLRSGLATSTMMHGLSSAATTEELLTKILPTSLHLGHRNIKSTLKNYVRPEPLSQEGKFVRDMIIMKPQEFAARHNTQKEVWYPPIDTGL